MTELRLRFVTIENITESNNQQFLIPPFGPPVGPLADLPVGPLADPPVDPLADPPVDQQVLPGVQILPNMSPVIFNDGGFSDTSSPTFSSVSSVSLEGGQHNTPVSEDDTPPIYQPLNAPQNFPDGRDSGLN